MSISKCCITGFQWAGTPTGSTTNIYSHDVYITGTNKHTAIILIADLFGWTFPNIRLLADHFAQEVDATVYVPDFFNGEVLPFDLIREEKLDALDLPGFLARNGRGPRDPEILGFTRALRSKGGYEKIGAVGYCYGGWASFRLGAKQPAPGIDEKPLVDCISIGHPSLLEKKDIEEVDVPVQVLAPEFDRVFTREMKSFTFETLMDRNVPFEYQHFPGVVHACFVRGDENKPGEREAMVRAKNSAVVWFRRFLKNEI